MKATYNYAYIFIFYSLPSFALFLSFRAEINSLESSLSTLRDKYQHDLDAAPSGAVSVLPQFNINTRFTLNQDEGSYSLTIETECPLDTVVLQCDVPVDLQEVDKSLAAISYTPPDPEVLFTASLLHYFLSHLK